jgi:hypothetical protein
VQGWHGEVMASSTIRPITPEQAARIRTDFDALAERHPRFGQYLEHHLPFYEKLLRYTA